MNILGALKVWKEVNSAPAQTVLLDETVNELSRLYLVEALAGSIARALVAGAADPHEAVPTGAHTDVQRLHNLTAHLDPSCHTGFYCPATKMECTRADCIGAQCMGLEHYAPVHPSDRH